MRAAAAPRPDPLRERLLRVDPLAGTFADATIADLPGLLQPGDVLVVNDAATLPASLRVPGPPAGPAEVRLAGEQADGTWTAVLFGAGDWRQRTEERPAPPPVVEGQRLWLGPGLEAVVQAVSPHSPRLVTLRFGAAGAALWSALYRLGRPVQYSYLEAPLRLAETQTAYASRPWAVEIPSAGRPLRPDLLVELRRRGIAVTRVTHAAGLSATGDPVLDDLLPLPERFDIPAETVAAVSRAREEGGRVVAAGTTVVRALEGSAAGPGGVLIAGAGVTDVKVTAGHRLRVVDGLLTGLHEPGSSHFRLLQAFASDDVLQRARQHAEDEGYLAHEFGDASLILPQPVASARASHAMSAASFSS